MSSPDLARPGWSQGRPAGMAPWAVAGVATTAVVTAVIVAILIAAGLWFVAAGLLVVWPAFVIVNRYPMGTLMVWIAVDPILMAGEGEAGRMLYWLIHRALPVGTLLLVFVARLIGARTQRFPRLGWPEAFMGGYLALTVLSIAYRSQDVASTLIYGYDHVLVPLSVYLLVRLLRPTEEDFRRLVPVLVFLLVTQAAVGLISLVAPDLLPAAWNNREARTTGTLRHPNVYSVTLLFAGLFLAHAGQARGATRGRAAGSLVVGVAVGMAIASLSRASWLAAVVVVAGLFFVYRSVAKRIVATVVVLGLVGLMVGGVFTTAQEALAQRFYSQTSEESALSRLPVVLASLRMIEARPVLGWGYENFDRYDRTFAGSIDGLFVPDRDHASHNFFLTLGAESGLLGVLLYLGPAVLLLARSRAGVAHLPATGVRSKRLVWILWLAMAAQVVAYNFSNNRVAFGLGLWWLCLGLIATLCDWDDTAVAQANDDLGRRIEALGGSAARAGEGGA